jgi:hypothetical protein
MPDKQSDELVRQLLAEADREGITLSELLERSVRNLAVTRIESSPTVSPGTTNRDPDTNSEPPSKMPNEVRKEWVAYWRNIVGLIRDGGLLAVAVIFLLFYVFGRDPQNLDFRQWRDLAIAAFGLGMFITGALVFDNNLVGAMGALEKFAKEHGQGAPHRPLSRIRSILALAIARIGRTGVRFTAALFFLLLGGMYAWGVFDMAKRYSEPSDTPSTETPNTPSR